MRTNKINIVDLFTQAANDEFKKHIKTQSKRALETINQKINWDELINPIQSKLESSKNKKSLAGRSPFSLAVIVKCFILQTIYNLSDPRLEEEIADRRSFQIFLGLTSGDSIPDETTLVRYRKIFSSLGLDKMLFDSILEKGYRNIPLSKTQKKVNRILSSVRNEVEKTFAFMKNVLGYRRCSYYDLQTNRFEFIFASFVFNIRRMISLTT